MTALKTILGVMGRKKLVLILVFEGSFLACFSQQPADTTHSKGLVDRFTKNKTTQRLMSSFTRKRDTLFNVKSEDAYVKYEGKIVRRIIIEHIGFEKNIIDTAHTMRSIVARTANHLHRESRDWVIRDNLFIRAGKPLNSYRIADNERYLRDLDFILDSRIFVKPIETTTDLSTFSSLHAMLQPGRFVHSEQPQQIQVPGAGCQPWRHGPATAIL